MLRHRHDRVAGMLLLMSVATPTYFAEVMNLAALGGGIALLVLPGIDRGVRQAVRFVQQH